MITVSYEEHVRLERARLNEKISDLSQRLLSFNQKAKAAANKKINALNKKLEELENSSPYSKKYQLLLDAIDAKGTRFHPSMRELYFYRVKASEGPGERLYRRHHGLNENAAGSPTGRDVPEHNNLELKSLYTTKKVKATNERPWSYIKYDITTLRAGACAATSLRSALYEAPLALMEMGYARDPKMKEVVTGSLSKKQREYLPKNVWQIFWDHLKPSVGLSECYGGLSLLIPEGWLYVPPEDFDEAFEIDCVSKGLVSYAVNSDYLLRIKNESATERSTNSRTMSDP